VSKLAAEFYAVQFYTLYDLKTVCLRYFNVFGPRQDPSSEYSAVVPKFVRTVLEESRPVIYGDGEQTRDFTFVKNVVSANLLACGAPEEACGEVFNVGTGGRISLLEVLEIIGREGSGKKVDPEFAPARKGDVKDSLADIEKARQLLGYEVEVGLEEGLLRTFDYYKQNC
jgi:UDP-glucose 4-epimerase